MFFLFCLLACSPKSRDFQDGSNEATEAAQFDAGSEAQNNEGLILDRQGDWGQLLEEGELCDPQINNCEAGQECIHLKGKQIGYCAIGCDCSNGSGCSNSSFEAVCFWTNSEETQCWCAILCPGGTAAQCPNGGEGWSCSEMRGQKVCIPNE